MSLIEYTLDGKIDKVAQAVERVKLGALSPEPLYVCYSGGKDSKVLRRIVEIAVEIKMREHYVEKAKQETVREILQEVYDTFAKKVENGSPNRLYDDFTSQVVKIIANRHGIELEKDNGQRRNI